MSSTATVPAVRLPPGALPQSKGLYQFFPYMQTLYFDGTHYHDITPATPPNFNNPLVNNVNTPHYPPVDNKQQRPVSTRPMNPAAPEYHPFFKLPPKEPKAVPIRNPQFAQSAKDKVLDHIVGKEPKRPDCQVEFTFKAPATNDLNSSTSTLFSQKESTTPPEGQPPGVSDIPKIDPPASKEEPKKSGDDVDIDLQSSANATETGKNAERVSRSGWKTVSPPPVNDASVAESKLAPAPVPSFSDAWDQQKNRLTATSPDKTGSKPPICPTHTPAAQTPVPDAIRPSSASSVAEHGSLPSTRVVPPPSNSGWMPEIPRVLPDNGWKIPSIDKIRAERTRIQPPQPISLGGWGESHDDHAMDEFEIPPEDFQCETSVHNSETTVPNKKESQPTSSISPQAPIARNDPSPIIPPKVFDTKQVLVAQPISPSKTDDTPVAPSAAKPKDVTAGIQEWQMLSKKAVSKVPAIPESNENSGDTVFSKMAALSISQPAEKPLEPKVEVKMEAKPCEVAQSKSESYVPTALLEASEPEVHDLIFDAGPNESSKAAQDSTLNSMGATRGRNEECAGNETPTLDWPATEKNENKKEPEKAMDVPSFDNSSSPTTPMKPQEVTSFNTTGARGDYASMWAPPNSDTKTMAPTRGPLLLRLKVKLPEGKLAFLEFHEGDCPQTIAERWCRVWKIPDAITQAKIIANGIGAQLQKMRESAAKN